MGVTKANQQLDTGVGIRAFYGISSKTTKSSVGFAAGAFKKYYREWGTRK